MEATQKPLKLNVKRTMLIGFAFFGILLLWQVYDSWCPTFLSELFVKMSNADYEVWRSTAANLSDQARVALANGDYTFGGVSCGSSAKLY